MGPPAASDEMIKANVKVKVGDTYTLTGVNDDVKALLSTGLFRDVRVSEERPPQGLTIIYVVQGHPILTDIRFEGNKIFSSSRLMGKVEVGVMPAEPIPGAMVQPIGPGWGARYGKSKMKTRIGRPLDERWLFEDARAIAKYYEKKGYLKTEVNYRVEIDENAGRGTVTFEMAERPKLRIQDIRFVGAQAFSQRKLRKVFKKGNGTRRYFWLTSWATSGGVLKDDQFEDDKDKLIEFYQNEGYIDFEIKEVRFDQVDPKHIVVRLIISEGKQYKVGAVEFRGNSLFKAEEIIKGDRSAPGIKMGVGAVFTPKGLETDIEAIRDFYGSKGYIDVWVKPVKSPNTTRGTMDLIYEIHDEDKGLSHVEKIEIKGNTKTKDRVIRRELAVSPGEVFDMVRVKRTKGRLEQLRYFEKVETSVEPTDIAGRKNLVIDVEETPTGHIEFWAGFSSVYNVVGGIGFREGNFDLFNPPFFRGGGQKFRINVMLGTKLKDFQISFAEPWLFGRRLRFETDLYHRELNYYSDFYDITQTGTRLGLVRALGSEFFIGGLSYTIENIGLKNVSDRLPSILREEEGNRLVSKIGASLAYDSRNNLQLPTQGQRTELTSELAGGPFAGDTDFYKFELRSGWYFPGFLENHIWEIRGRGGVVESYGDTDRVPLFDRFFLGGVGSLRGYKYRQVGPYRLGPEGDLEPIGGNTYWFGSIEYSVPIIERLRFAAFYDIGNVYEDAFSFTRSAGQKLYNDNWGVGVRLNIPHLGPLRLDYGIPITHDDFTSGRGRFQFSVSYTSDY
ncbi:MAG: outer membrane protein assembly factor BamA [Verrucomicrobia bacterium]|nr:outer membrane protein assembly factor BamA [Verrucomicrobiota bacterium]